MNDDQLRISDAERDQAAAALGEHFAQGRLTAAEHSERLDQIWAARTRAQLQPVFRDLPLAAPPAVRRATRSHRGPFPGLLFPILAVLLVLTLVTHKPFLLIGLMVALFVIARRRGSRRLQRWPS